jgi:hypothetical protein
MEAIAEEESGFRGKRVEGLIREENVGIVEKRKGRCRTKSTAAQVLVGALRGGTSREITRFHDGALRRGKQRPERSGGKKGWSSKKTGVEEERRVKMVMSK